MRAQIEQLADRKRTLVASIALSGADKKSLGREIGQVNEALASLMEPLRVELAHRLEALAAQQADAAVLSDRTYPLCYWSPLEVARRAR